VRARVLIVERERRLNFALRGIGKKGIPRFNHLKDRKEGAGRAMRTRVELVAYIPSMMNQISFHM